MQVILELDIVSGSGVGHETPDFETLSEGSNYRIDSQSTVAGPSCCASVALRRRLCHTSTARWPCGVSVSPVRDCSVFPTTDEWPGPPSLVLISLCHESSALSAERATTHLVATEADGRSFSSSGPSRTALDRRTPLGDCVHYMNV